MSIALRYESTGTTRKHSFQSSHKLSRTAPQPTSPPQEPPALIKDETFKWTMPDDPKGDYA
jgi:hypothetical protein